MWSFLFWGPCWWNVAWESPILFGPKYSLIERSSLGHCFKPWHLSAEEGCFESCSSVNVYRAPVRDEVPGLALNTEGSIRHSPGLQGANSWSHLTTNSFLIAGVCWWGTVPGFGLQQWQHTVPALGACVLVVREMQGERSCHSRSWCKQSMMGGCPREPLPRPPRLCVSLALGTGDRVRTCSWTGKETLKSHPDPGSRAASSLPWQATPKPRNGEDTYPWPHGENYGPEHLERLTSHPSLLLSFYLSCSLLSLGAREWKSRGF